MKRFWILTLLVCTVVVVASQVGPSGGARFAWALDEQGPRLYGMVAGDGVELKNLPVYVIAERDRGTYMRVITGPAGQYEFRELPPGQYTITAFTPNHGPISESESVLWEGTSSERMDLVLVPGESGSLSGDVIDVFSQGGVKDAQVRLVSNTTSYVRSAKSDSEGAFEIGNVPPGPYTLLVAAKGWGVTPWPDAIEMRIGADAGSIELAFPENLEAFGVRGTVHDGTAGLEGVEILVMDGLKNGELHLSTTDRNGQFEIMINPSPELYFWVRKFDRGAMWLGSSVGLTTHELGRMSEAGLNLQLSEQTFGPWGVSGQVHRSGMSVSGGWVEAVDVDGRVCDIAPVWPDGRYQLAHLISGEYSLNLSIPGSSHSASQEIRIRSTSVESADFDLGQMTQKL